MREYLDKMKLLFDEMKIDPINTAMLFSGGLDTSILAALNPSLPTYTVCLKGAGEDLFFSQEVIKYLGLNGHHKIVEPEEALTVIPRVIRILKSFDPALPNDITAYLGLKEIQRHGFRKAVTGDASDELFGGYSFMQEIEDLASYIQKISERMSFSSSDIGRSLDLEIIQPFLKKNIVDFALKLPVEYKIRNEGAEKHGKWILRKASEDLLPKNIAWQSKRPLEIGSGMTKLRGIIESSVPDKEFDEAKNELNIKFYNKEHYYYYKIYMLVVGEIPKPVNGEKRCPGCGGGMPEKAFHCQICGFIINGVLK
jgi:asparagine synthase (glutamine-hydrolysing)